MILRKLKSTCFALILLLALATSGSAVDYRLQSGADQTQWCESANWKNLTDATVPGFPYKNDDQAFLETTATLTLSDHNINALDTTKFEPNLCKVSNEADVTLILVKNPDKPKVTFSNLDITNGKFTIERDGDFNVENIVITSGALNLSFTGNLAAPTGSDAIEIANRGNMAIDGPTITSKVKLVNSGILSLGSFKTNDCSLDITANSNSSLNFTKNLPRNLPHDVKITQAGAAIIKLENTETNVGTVTPIEIQGNGHSLTIQGGGTMTATADSSTISLGGNGVFDRTTLKLTAGNNDKVTVYKNSTLSVSSYKANTNGIINTDVTLLDGAKLEVTGWGAVLQGNSNLEFKTANSTLKLSGTPPTSTGNIVLSVNGAVSAPNGFTIELDSATAANIDGEISILNAAGSLGITEADLSKITVKSSSGKFELRVTNSTLYLKRKTEVNAKADLVPNGNNVDYSDNEFWKFPSGILRDFSFTVSDWKYGNRDITLDGTSIKGHIRRGGLVKDYDCTYANGIVTCLIPEKDINENDAFEMYVTATYGGQPVEISGRKFIVKKGAWNGVLTATAKGATLSDENTIEVPKDTTVTFEIAWEDSFVKGKPATKLTLSNGNEVLIPISNTTGTYKFTTGGTYTVTATVNANYDIPSRANVITVKVSGSVENAGKSGGGCHLHFGSMSLVLVLAALVGLKSRKAS